MSQNQPNQEHNDILYVLAFILILLLVAKFFFGDAMLSAHLWLRKMWIDGMLVVSHNPALTNAHTAIDAYELDEWTGPRLSDLSKLVRWVAFPILGGTLAIYGWRIINRNPAGKYKRVFDMKKLAQAESSQWPWMLPVLDKDLINMPIDKGPYAMGMTEVEFARHYRLLESVDRLTINKLHAQKLFATQLGRLWEGPRRLRTHERALYAAFIAQICGKRSECLSALEILTRSSSAGQLDTTFTDELLAKYKDDKRVRLVVRRHAYVGTVMMAVLAKARRLGKISPSFMIWLRTVDRSLFYIIHSLDRRTPFPEGAGVYAHYQAELIAGHAIEYPFVGEAVEGLVHELEKVRLTQDYMDQLDVS
jgi:intracellular multiplication protein IcmP